MPLNKPLRLRDPQKREVVHQVKDMFLEYQKDNSEFFYDEDVELVKQMSFLLQRAIISRQKNVDESFKCLVEMLKFRKQNKLRELTDEQMPVEYFECGACFEYEKDKYGNKTLYVRTQILRAIPALRPSFKQYLSYMVYKVDTAEDNSSWSVVFDLTNTGWNNYDIDLLMYFLSLIRDYFPVNVDYVLLINFPWLLNAVWTLAKRLIPPERRDVIVFISDKEIFNYVEPENTPDFLNGTCKREHKLLNSKSTVSAVDFLLTIEPKLSAKQVREVIKAFKEIVPEERIRSMNKILESSGRT